MQTAPSICMNIYIEQLLFNIPNQYTNYHNENIAAACQFYITQRKQTHVFTKVELEVGESVLVREATFTLQFFSFKDLFQEDTTSKTKCLKVQNFTYPADL